MNTWDFAARVFETSWDASLLILVFLLAAPFARRWVPARFVFVGWLILAVHLLVPARISAPWGMPEFAVAGSGLETVFAELAHGNAPTIPTEEGITADRPDRSSIVGPEVEQGWTARNKGLGVLWFSGVVVLLSARVAASIFFARRMKKGRCEENGYLLQEVAESGRLLGLARTPRVMVTSGVEAPAIFGFWRPTLLFPAGFRQKFSADELRLMVLHELGHLRRRDVASNALLQAARIVHWFNPLVWIATRMAREECELACDEFVMRRVSSAEARAYGATLLKVLGVVRGQNRSPLVLGILENKQQLKRRIQMIVNYRTSTIGRVIAGTVLLAVLGFAAVTREARAAEVNGASGEVTTTAPAPWYKNGSKIDAYVVGSDPTQPHVKPVSAYIKSVEREIDGFGGMMQSFSAEDYRGKRVRFSAWVKSEDVKGTANVWMRVDGPGRAEDRTLQFDNMNGRDVVGTTAWTRHAVVLDVPQEAEGIAMGFFVSGTGQAWFNDADFEIVGADVPSTNTWKRPPRAVKERPRAPGNMDFSAKAKK